MSGQKAPGPEQAAVGAKLKTFQGHEVVLFRQESEDSGELLFAAN